MHGPCHGIIYMKCNTRQSQVVTGGQKEVGKEGWTSKGETTKANSQVFFYEYVLYKY